MEGYASVEGRSSSIVAAKAIRIHRNRTATVKKKGCINRKDAFSAVGAIEFPALAILAGIAQLIGLDVVLAAARVVDVDLGNSACPGCRSREQSSSEKCEVMHFT